MARAAHPMIALIPARGGSKGIPVKNLVLLGGMPLIAHTIGAAQAAERVDDLLLSTDDEGIAETCRGLGLEVPWLRPAELAGDHTPMVAVLTHALERLGADGVTPEALILLQPTSPLRRTEHIDAAVRTFRESDADTLVSVIEVPHQYTPDSLMRRGDDGLLEPLVTDAAPTRRQDKPTLYARNGPAILIIRPKIIACGNLYGERTIPFVMDAADSIDIDGPDDLLLAEWLLERREATPREESDR